MGGAPLQAVPSAGLEASACCHSKGWRGEPLPVRGEGSSGLRGRQGRMGQAQFCWWGAWAPWVLWADEGLGSKGASPGPQKVLASRAGGRSWVCLAEGAVGSA